MKKMNNRYGRGKQTTVFVIQARYCDQWEDVCEYFLDEEEKARDDFQRYLREEKQYPHRLIRRRVPNPNFQGSDKPEQ